MSVIKSKRSLSKHQAVMSAVELKEKVHDLCIRDFGIKDVEKVVRDKYIYGKEPTENLPKYVYELHKAKERLHYLSDELIANTRAANRIRMTSIRKCDLRLDYQDRAINNCEMLIGKIQDVASFFWVDLNIYKQYIEAIDTEIELLKNWLDHTRRKRNELTY